MADYDLVTLGRCSMDLFSENIGAPFVEIESFAAHIGGSPTNIAVAASRLGLRVALLTAVGHDPVGDFVLRTLAREGVDAQFIPRKHRGRTGMAVLGIEPPDKFPLVFYRENPADIYLDIDDVRAAPIGQSRALLLSGSALSKGPCRDATLYAAELALGHGVTTYIDLDLRPDQWLNLQDYGANLRAILPLVEVAIGTEEEVYAAVSDQLEDVTLNEGAAPGKLPEFDACARLLFRRYSRLQALVLKRGPHGADIYTRDSAVAPQPASGGGSATVGNQGARFRNRDSQHRWGRRRLCRRFHFRPSTGMGLAPERPNGQRLWGYRRHETRLRRSHALCGRGSRFCW